MATSMLLSLLAWAAVNVGHVLGHVITARIFRVTIDRISFGMGPTLWEKERTRGGTFRIALFPVGFLVRLRRPLDKDDPDAWRSEDPRCFRKRPFIVRLTIILAAPVVVFILAFGAAYVQSGLAQPVLRDAALIRPVAGGAAEQAGLRLNDQVISIAGVPVATWNDMSPIIARSRGELLVVEVLRKGKRRRLALRPQRVGQRWVIGVMRLPSLRQPPKSRARVGAAFGILGDAVASAGRGLRQLLGGEINMPAERIGGPVAVSSLYASRGAPRDSIRLAQDRYRLAYSMTLTFLHYLFLCLFPLFPYLDGRRIVFFFIEAALRRPPHPRYERWFNRITLGSWVFLFLVAMFEDLRRFWMV